MRRLFVYGWTGWNPKPRKGQSSQARCVVAVRSLAEVKRLTGLSANRIRDYGGETGNAEELRVALSRPGVVLWHPLDEYPPAGQDHTWKEAIPPE